MRGELTPLVAEARAEQGAQGLCVAGGQVGQCEERRVVVVEEGPA